MRFVQGLLVSKPSVQNALEDLFAAIREDCVIDEVWQRALAFEKLDEAIDLIRGNELHALCCAHEGCVKDVLKRSLAEFDRCLALKELSDADDQALSNAIVVATRFLAAAPTVGGSEAPLLMELWDQPDDGSLALGPLLINAAMSLLFKDMFTIEPPSKNGNNGAVAASPAEMPEGIEVRHLWATGVGVVAKGVGQGEPNEDTVVNRQLAMQLLLASICRSAPAAGHGKASTNTAGAASTSTKAPLPLACSLQEAREGVLGRCRGLAYLTHPKAPVPYRKELFYSLWSTIFEYDPVGTGVPYAGYFIASNHEVFVHLCVQVLTVLLLDTSSLAVDEGIVAWKPQEQVAQEIRASCTAVATEHTYFHQLLQGISSEKEVSFLFDGLLNICSTIVDTKRTMLPRSMKVPPFVPEMLLLITTLVAGEKFVFAISGLEDMNCFLCILVHMMYEMPSFISEDLSAMLASTALLRLTSCPELLGRMSDKIEDEPPRGLPKLDTHMGDLIAMAAMKQVSDKLSTSSSNQCHRCIVEACLSILANIAPFSPGLGTQSVFRFFANFERCAKLVQAQKSSSETLHWVLLMLESLMGMLQYRYSQNLDLVYGLVSRFTLLQGVMKAVELEVAEQSGSSEVAKQILEYLRPATFLLAKVLPRFENGVEKLTLVTSQDAKKLLPVHVQHLLPAPHAFTLRTMQQCVWVEYAAEVCLLRCFLEGPAGDIWEWEDAKSASKDGSAGSGGKSLGV